MNIGERILRLLYPPKCVFCGALLSPEEEGACEKCRAELPFVGEKCEAKAEFVEEVAAALYYKDKVPSSVRRYKFSGRAAYARSYAPLVASAVRSQLSDRYDCLCWVPISRKRLRKRGYDQGRELASALSRELGLPAERLLVKKRDNPAQSGIRQEAERRANVSGSYRAAAGAQIAGRRILLVDDVFTTGSTAGECARNLRLAGAQSVGCAVLAYAKRGK